MSWRVLLSRRDRNGIKIRSRSQTFKRLPDYSSVLFLSQRNFEQVQKNFWRKVLLNSVIGPSYELACRGHSCNMSLLYHLFHQPYLKEQVWGKHPWLQFLCTAPQILMSFIKGNKFKVHIKSTSKYACAQPTYFQRL